MNRFCAVLSLLLFCLPALAGNDVADLTVEEAWVREAPPNARTLAAYMTLVNRAEQPIRVTGVTSPDFATAELHRTVVEDGIARMLPVEALEVPAHGRQVLEPGGLHLMLIDPQRPLSEGDSVILDIRHSDGAHLRINTPVLRKTASDDAHHHHHH